MRLSGIGLTASGSSTRLSGTSGGVAYIPKDVCATPCLLLVARAACPPPSRERDALAPAGKMPALRAFRRPRPAGLPRPAHRPGLGLAARDVLPLLPAAACSCFLQHSRMHLHFRVRRGRRWPRLQRRSPIAVASIRDRRHSLRANCPLRRPPAQTAPATVGRTSSLALAAPQLPFLAF